MWLLNGWEDGLKPSNCGVVFDISPEIIRVNGKDVSAVQACVKPGMAKRFWTEQPVCAAVLAILDRGQAVLFRTSNDSAFAVYQEAGIIHCNEDDPSSTPNNPGPKKMLDAFRLAAKVLSDDEARR